MFDIASDNLVLKFISLFGSEIECIAAAKDLAQIGCEVDHIGSN